MKRFNTQLIASAAAFGACLLLAASAAMANGSVEGKVASPDLKAHRGVVVYLKGKDLSVSTPKKPPHINQKNMQFTPSVISVVKGGTVAFPNSDRTMHNVFSRSPSNSFDLGFYKRGKVKGVQFDKPGPVDVYCNIHPQMVANIFVAPNDFHTVVDSDGSFKLEGIPAGTYELVLWSPYTEEMTTKVKIGDSKASKANFKLPAPKGSDKHLNKHGSAYGRYK